MPLLNRACQRLRQFADDLFLHDDLRAHHRGWSVAPIHAGTGRRYRDPRWDRLSECRRCTGAGYLGIDACPGCGGRGVVDALRPVTSTEEPAADEPPSPAPIRVSARRLDLPPARHGGAP